MAITGDFKVAKIKFLSGSNTSSEYEYAMFDDYTPQALSVIETLSKFSHSQTFGLLQNQQLFFLVVTGITLLLIGYIYVRLPKVKHYLYLRISLLAIVAGAIGNMIDRVRQQFVVDFFYFKLIDFPIFNVADIYATVATFALIALFLFYYKEEDFDVIFKLFTFKKGTK